MSEQTLQQVTVSIDGGPLSVPQVCVAANSRGGTKFNVGPDVASRMALSVEMVAEAVRENRRVYGVTTGFGGMACSSVDSQMAAASQNNLLRFLAASAGPPIDRRHVRAAMLLRANVLARGCSGIRFEIVERILRFLETNATPIVREYGSIGASGDLVPLSAIARAVTGQSDHVRVQRDNRVLTGAEALREVGYEALELLPKEGLAIVNGTSFSSAIAAHAVFESRNLLALTMATQAMMLQALQVQLGPFAPFVHECKPHPGQVWAADMMCGLLKENVRHQNGKPMQVQDRYSLRCLPQYMGPAVEALSRIEDVVTTEMNSVSDNPIIDVDAGSFHQSGNFLGQYVGVAMDDLRRHIGLLAKHLDVQIATLVTPEFSNGLPASLQGNSAVSYNMGLKGLQITGNSIMPLLTYNGNSIVDHYPTHAEQFNQNINGLSWGASNLAWKSVLMYQHYMSVAMLFAVQALDLRSHQVFGHYDGRALLSGTLEGVYDSVCKAIQISPRDDRPMLRDDSDLWLEDSLAQLQSALAGDSTVGQSVASVVDSYCSTFRN